MSNDTALQTASTDIKLVLRITATHLRNSHRSHPLTLSAIDAALHPVNQLVAAEAPITKSAIADAMLNLIRIPQLANTGSFAEPDFGSFAEALEAAVAEVERTVGHKVEGLDAPAPVAAPAPAQPAPAQRCARPHFDEIPEGRYAVATEEGHVAFYRVVHKEYPSGVYAFANLLTGAPGSWRETKMSRDAGAGVLAKIAANHQAAAVLFGHKTQTCTYCGSPLSNPQSRATGAGEHCAAKHGIAYKSPAEAASFLDEQGGADA